MEVVHVVHEFNIEIKNIFPLIRLREAMSGQH